MAFEGLSEKLQNAFKKLTGKGKLNEQNIKDAMREVLGVKTVFTGNDKKGKITLSYNSTEELEGIFQAITKLLM